MARAKAFQRFGLDRRVADDLEKLFVRPHVVLERRDVEVSDQNGVFLGRMPVHFGKEPELVGKLVVQFRIGDIATGRHVIIVQREREAIQFVAGGKMAGVGPTPERAGARLFQRVARQRCDTVIALLAVDRDVAITESFKHLERKQVVRAFGLLQTQDVRRAFPEQPLNDGRTQADGVDVPSGNRKRHGGFLREQVVNCCPVGRTGTSGGNHSSPSMGGISASCGQSTDSRSRTASDQTGHQSAR